MSKRREFHMDLNLTNQCSLRCTYCIETGLFKAKNCNEVIPKFYEWIDRFIVSDFFKSVTDVLHISLWGGEPTLEWGTILELMKRYENENRVQFMLYTNGYHLPDELRKAIIGVTERNRSEPTKYSPFRLQISYDGQPVQDLCRKTVAGKPSAEQVLKTVRWAQDNEVGVVLKSTITVELLKHLYEAWEDVNEVTKGRQHYFPTVDYFNQLTPEQLKDFDEHLVEMKTGMKKIAAAILRARAEGRRVSGFKWFEPSVATCSAGQKLFGLDVDGKIYSCHSTFYSPTKQDHLIGTLDDDFSIFERSAIKHNGPRPEECRTCEAVFCLNCSATRYSRSDKETYTERWMDYTRIETSCRLYREISKVTRAYLQLRDAA